MKFLCLDYGEKRTGVAVSDDGGCMAFPRAVIVKTTRQDFFASLGRFVESDRPQAFVLGLPLHGDGAESQLGRQVRNLAKSLKHRFGLPVYFMDESFSSAEAESMLRESRQKSYLRDGRVDSLAAARILESFLNLPEEKRAGMTLQPAAPNGRTACLGKGSELA